MSFEDSADCHKLKAAILKKYELTGEAHSQQFRGVKWKNFWRTKWKDEPFHEFVVKLLSRFDHWVKAEKIVTSFEPL